MSSPPRRAHGGRGARLGGLVLAIVPLPRGLRWRLRMRHPAAARVADRLADHATAVLLALAGLLALAAALPQPPGDLPRLWLAGSAVLLLTGVPFALERRALRRRVGLLPPLQDPLAGIVGEVDAERRRAALDALHASRRRFTAARRAAAAPGEGDGGAPARRGGAQRGAGDAGAPTGASARAVPLAEGALGAGDGAAAVALLDEHLAAAGDDAGAARLRALVGAWFGEPGSARAFALRSAQIDPARWNDMVDTASLLALRGRFTQAARLADLAVERSGGLAAAEVALAQVLARGGRLRDAAAALDRAEGRERPLLPPQRRSRRPPPAPP